MWDLAEIWVEIKLFLWFNRHQCHPQTMVETELYKESDSSLDLAMKIQVTVIKCTECFSCLWPVLRFIANIVQKPSVLMVSSPQHTHSCHSYFLWYIWCSHWRARTSLGPALSGGEFYSMYRQGGLFFDIGQHFSLDIDSRKKIQEKNRKVKILTAD